MGVGRTRKLDLRPVHLPSLERVRNSWKEDAFFGYQFLNGANPMVLKRSTRLPARLVFPPGMEKLQAQLNEELEVWTSKHQEGQAGKWKRVLVLGVQRSALLWILFPAGCQERILRDKS